MPQKISNIIAKVKAMTKTRRGKNILTFGVFLVVATLFWFMMSLNDEVQRDYAVKIQLSDMPKDITLLSDAPLSIDVSVNDRGRNLIKYDWGESPKIELKFSDFSIIDDKMIIGNRTVKSKVRKLFSNSAEIGTIRPDSIVLPFTSSPGVKLPVVLNLDVISSPQYIIHGNIIVSPDSVTIFAADGVDTKMSSVRTKILSVRNISDTMTYKIAIATEPGMRAIPATVEVTVPVEPLITKNYNIPIKTVNVPNSYNLLAFPSTVEVSCLIPMSLYNDASIIPKATINFNDTHSKPQILNVTVESVSDYSKVSDVSPKTVEYIVEHTISGINF